MRHVPVSEMKVDHKVTVSPLDGDDKWLIRVEDVSHKLAGGA